MLYAIDMVPAGGYIINRFFLKIKFKKETKMGTSPLKKVILMTIGVIITNALYLVYDKAQISGISFYVWTAILWGAMVVVALVVSNKK